MCQRTRSTCTAILWYVKNEYAPALHARGVRLVRGIDYSELLKVPYAGTTPTEAEFDAYAKELLTKFVDDLGIDGLDIDMETRPSEKDIVLSNGVIRALSKYIGPKSGTDRPFCMIPMQNIYHLYKMSVTVSIFSRINSMAAMTNARNEH